MAEAYDMIKLGNGQIRYRNKKAFVKKTSVPQIVLDALTEKNIVNETGLIIVDDKGAEEGKLTADEEAKAEEQGDDTNTNKEEETDDESTDDSDSEDSDDDDADDLPPAADPDDVLDVTPPSGKPKPAAKPKNQRKEPVFISKTPQSKPGMGFPRVNGKTVDIFDGKTPHTHIKLIGGYTVPLSTESFNDRSEKEIEDKLVELGFELRNFGNTPGGIDESVNDDLGEGDDDGVNDDLGEGDDDGLTDDHV